MDLEEQELLCDRMIVEGVEVRTKKGANFTGVPSAKYFHHHMKHWGLVVIAIRADFAGTAHVYPVMQLERAP